MVPASSWRNVDSTSASVAALTAVSEFNRTPMSYRDTTSPFTSNVNGLSSIA
jgi:hypothetical protein